MPAAWGDDSGWRKITANIRRGKNAYVKVGVLAGAARGPGFDAVALAATHEFGSEAAGIPERSFIRRTFTVQREALAKTIAKLAHKVVTDDMPMSQALGLLGTWGAAQVKGTIRNWTWAAADGGLDSMTVQELKPGTIAAKGSDRPLVDTGRLLDSISYEVVE